ncbi:MIP/aquaporin family protein [Alicyclobacillus tolerans]|uniref:Glycerol uptake facilitator protein n=1 Tax=Alicyclobacillus tolerans TaxID=90970 RepID=A0ABT9LXL0_9BACL|nr:MIP/aquaporin family protein [Alicyclobacillus tengchongensis]MDP9729003.1 glycerol uptake facilitator protein [Alicyclobacillus tengchongensis]
MSIAFQRKSWRCTLMGELIAEFFGTLLLIAFGDGVVAVAVVGLSESGRTPPNLGGNWLLITWGWAFAVALAVYVTGGVNGAHMNPAVSFAMAIKGDLPWKKFIPYSISQIVGAFCGAAIVYWDYYRAIDAFNVQHHITSLAGMGGSATFGIFATSPAPYFSHLWGPLLDQILGTMFLLLFILGITDMKNMGVQGNLGPFMIGIAVAAIGMSFGVDAGYAINPARDFGPRLFAWIVGYGHNAFPGPLGYWWVPIVGPIIGGGLAVFVYRWFIEKTLIERASIKANLKEGVVSSENITERV